MSFNGSGTFVPPAGQPVATGTVIQSATFNTLVTDIGNTFNNVLPRDGQASMAGQLKIIDGTSSVPGIAFNSEAASGIFRPASGMLALTVSGVEGMRLNNSGRVLIGSTVDDATNKLQVTGAVKVTGALTATSFVGPVTGTATNVTGVVAIANGGTGATTTAGAAQSIGAVQQGTGIGQSSNVVKLGWGASGGGLKATVDATDMGYIPFSATNPSSGGAATFGAVSATGAVTLGSTLSVAGVASLGAFTASGTSSHSGMATFSGGANVTAGSFTSASPLQINGGSSVQLATGNGFAQIGSTGAANLIADSAAIQARNNGVANTLSLNYYGGQVNVGGAAASLLNVTGRVASTGDINAAGTIYAQSPNNLKIGLFDSGSARGYISASSTSCFAAINAANSAYTFSVDNSGNTTTTGTATLGGNLVAQGGIVQVGQSSGTYTFYRYDGTMSINGGAFNSILTTASSLNTNNIVGFFPAGLAEVGRYLDFHSVNSANDFDVRIDCTPPTGVSGTSQLIVSASALVCTGNVTANSDETLKANWQSVDDDFLTNLSRVKSGIYDRLDMQDTKQMGVSAQSLQKVAPHAVLENGETGLLSVAYGNVALVASVELSKKVLALEAELNALKEALMTSREAQ